MVRTRGRCETEHNMWMIQIFDLQAEGLREVEASVRAMDGVTMASALRGDQPYVVAECPTESDAIRVQVAVAAVDPAAIVVSTTEGADPEQELIGL
jgi:hypothetical protein